MTETHVFYYPWYGNPATDGAYRHWQNNGHTPPSDIDSNYYPVAGAYSSNSTTTLAQHMQWIRQAGITVVVIAWWGQGTFEDLAVPGILNAANAQGIKVSFMIDQYPGRNISSIDLDIKYIYTHYGSHPAFYKTAKPNKWGASIAKRGVFYIYAPDIIGASDAAWAVEWDSLRGTVNDGIFLDGTGSLGAAKCDARHVDGQWNYGVQGVVTANYSGIGKALSANNNLWVPTTGPGYIDLRNGGSGVTSRDSGAEYDRRWADCVMSSPTFVSITSFNEWHEGSQIEPAIVEGSPYSDYEGAYGKTGVVAQTAYLDRTKYWTLFNNFGYKTVKDAVVAILQGVNSVNVVYGKEEKALKTFPAACVSAKSHENQFEDTVRNKKQVNLYIRLYFRTDERNDPDYEDVIETCADDVISALEHNLTLKGVCDWSIPTTGDWQFGEKEVPVRVLEITISAIGAIIR